MSEIFLPIEAISEQSKAIENRWQENQSWWNSAAYFCFTGCIASGIIGLFLSGISYLFGTAGTGSKFGTVLVFAAFPLMLFGAHALDKISEK